MKKVYVVWDFTDEYGRSYSEDARVEWFETMEQAEAFIEKKKRGNGSYFKLWKVAEGNYNEFLYMEKLAKEYYEIKERFYGL